MSFDAEQLEHGFMIPRRLFLRATRATNRGRFMAGAVLLDEKQPFETLAKHDKIVIHSLVMYGNTIVPRGDFPDDMIDNFQVEKIKVRSWQRSSTPLVIFAILFFGICSP